MIRKSMLVLGVCAAVVWWVGLSQNHRASILWMYAIGAALSFTMAGLLDEPDEQRSRSVVPALIGMGFAALFVVGSASRQPAWLNTFSFLFAFAYLAVAIISNSMDRRLARSVAANRRLPRR